MEKLENQRKIEISTLQNQLKQIKELNSVENNNLQFDAERMAYNTTIRQLKNKIIELENNNREKCNDRENYYTIQLEKDKIIQELTEKIIELENKLNFNHENQVSYEFFNYNNNFFFFWERI